MDVYDFHLKWWQGHAVSRYVRFGSHPQQVAPFFAMHKKTKKVVVSRKSLHTTTDWWSLLLAFVFERCNIARGVRESYVCLMELTTGDDNTKLQSISIHCTSY